MEPEKFTTNPFTQNISITQESNQKVPTRQKRELSYNQCKIIME